MNALDMIRQLGAHCAWADAALFEHLQSVGENSEAWREYSHVLGAEAVWLARLERRASSVAVWPTLTMHEAEALRSRQVAGYAAYVATRNTDSLLEAIEYRNSAGQHFTTAVGDILMHVMLHGQYHRGKINLLLRQTGHEPVGADYITFVRGIPAAITPLPHRA